MKNFKAMFYLIMLGVLKISSTSAQTTTLGNAGGAGQYLGWDAFTNQALEIRQNNVTTPYAIEFWTNMVKRVEIEGTTGNVGIGTPPLVGAFNYKLTVDNDINFASSAWLHG